MFEKLVGFPILGGRQWALVRELAGPRTIRFGLFYPTLPQHI